MAFLTTSDFHKSFHKLDSSIQKEVTSKLKFLQVQENPLLFAKKIKGYKDIFRFRAGDYRILFRLENQDIILLLVKHRGNIYAGI